LRSWTPRRPSPELKARVFGAREGTLALPLSIHSALAWLTPATCALALTLSCWMIRYETASGAPYVGSNLLATISLPHLSLADSNAVPAAEPVRNTWTAANVDWEKVSLNVAPTGMFASWRTNIHKL